MNNKKIIIDNQSQLQDLFKDNSLRLKKKSKLVFIGKLNIGSNVSFEGDNLFGRNNKIDSNCKIVNLNLGNNNYIKMSSYLINSKINNKNIIGPYAYIRDNTTIKNSCIMGAYVEVTRSEISNNCLASHRAFIGDTKIGKETIIGAGTVFCNFNFLTMKKEKTIVGSKCKIGSNSTIIAPLKIRPNTLIPAFTKYKG